MTETPNNDLDQSKCRCSRHHTNDRNENDNDDPFAVPHRPERQRVRKTEPMAESIPHAKVDVIAPDGTIEDSVIVRFGYKQPLGIDPTEWMERGYFGDEYKLELVYVSTGNKFITERTESQNDKQT